MERTRSRSSSGTKLIRSTKPGCFCRMGSTSLRSLWLNSSFFSGFKWHSTMRVNIIVSSFCHCWKEKFRPAARTPEEQAETARKVDYCLLRMTAEIIFLSGAGDFHKKKDINWLYIAINSFIYNNLRRRRLHLWHQN